MSMSDAIEAIRSEEFDVAIPFFEELTRERPIYHIGWLRLGYALREKAVRLAHEDLDEAVRLLNRALSALGKAAEHVDPEYQAQALYETVQKCVSPCQTCLRSRTRQDSLHRVTPKRPALNRMRRSF